MGLRRFEPVPHVPTAFTTLSRFEEIIRRNLSFEKGEKFTLSASFASLEGDRISIEEIVEDCEHEFACDLKTVQLNAECTLADLFNAIQTLAR